MLSIQYTLEDLAAITGGELYQRGKTVENIHDIFIDSRRLVNPEGRLFVALKSKKNDGHNYIPELYKKGVRYFLIDYLPADIDSLLDADFIKVNNTFSALQKIAVHHRQKFDIPVIGITGSNGKTIVKEWLYQLLNDDYDLIRSPKSYNSQIGVPLSVLQMNNEHQLAIFEAGISGTDEMDNLVKIIRPTMGIFTNIGHAHDENFINASQKTGEKLKLFTAVNTLFYSSDHFNIREQIIKSELSTKINIRNWGTNGDPDLLIKGMEKKDIRTTIFAEYEGEELSITIPFIDAASIENALHCWMVMLHLGYENGRISERMNELSPVAMRLELKEGINHCLVINDSYNCDINSLGIALDFMNQQKQHQKKIVILSDILQSGMNDFYLYQSVHKLLKEKEIDRLIGIGPAISDQVKQFQDMEAIFFKDTDEFLDKFSLATLNNETILLKGARVFEFERINKVLQQQAHETIMEINLDALVDNFNYFRSIVNPDTKIMAMVKAFSYGSGSFEIANILQYYRADYLGVAYSDEGVELRRAGITLPLMVMNPEEHTFDTMIRYNLEPEIYSFRVLSLLEQAIQRNIVQDQRPFGIHLKLDTGMRRLGFTEEEIDDLIERIKQNPRLKVQSVFSHLAGSDESKHADFTYQQIELFRNMSDKILQALDYPVIRHIANSAAITRYPEGQFDMVRLGIGLYGIATDKAIQEKLRNVTRLKSTISQIKSLKKGETVGYGRAFRAKQDMKIAVVNIGYADGLSRILSNGRGKLWVKRESASIIGNICMDMCMIDISRMDVKEGEEVIVFEDQNSIEEIAEKLETIPYEVLTNVSRRVQRVYYHDG